VTNVTQISSSAPPSPPISKARSFLKSIDLEDVFLVLGVVFIVAGIAAWSRAAASIVLGVFFLACVRSIALTRRNTELRKGRL
jgi:hypothetical protein